MSFRELRMIDVKEILRRWQMSQSARQIGRDAGVDRKTAQRYIDEAVELELPRDRPLTEEEVHAVAQRVQARSQPAPSEAWEALVPHKSEIEVWLGGNKPLKLSKVLQLLARGGVETSYATLRRFAIAELGWSKRAATVRVNDAPPGAEAQVDFGLMGRITDAVTGRVRKLWALIVTLCFSRYQFVWPTFEQTTEAVCEGLDEAWKFFGGIAHTIVPDNMKAIIDEADPLTPRIVVAFAEYAQARGLLVDPARVRRPKDKARVERQVPYARDSWFVGESITSLAEARQSARHWCLEIAGTRVHGTTRRVPREVYEAEERPHMLPPPEAPFDVPHWGKATVHADHPIHFLRALYSVPHLYLHKEVRVRADRTLVRVYVGTELVKTHLRMPPGGRATDPNDYPPGKSAYALRDVTAVIARAKAAGHHVGVYAERVLAGPLPWARMRAAYALVRLCDTYGAGRVEALCQSALAFDVVDVSRLAKMLQRAECGPAADTTENKVVSLPRPRFARADEQFRTRKGTSDKEGT
jgi:Integrase core domain